MDSQAERLRELADNERDTLRLLRELEAQEREALRRIAAVLDESRALRP